MVILRAQLSLNSFAIPHCRDLRQIWEANEKDEKGRWEEGPIEGP